MKQGEILSDHVGVYSSCGIGVINIANVTYSHYLVGNGPYADTQIAIAKSIDDKTGELTPEAEVYENKQVAWIVDLMNHVSLLGVAEAGPRIISKLLKILDNKRYYCHWSSTDSIKDSAMQTWNSDCRLIICDMQAWHVDSAFTFTWNYMNGKNVCKQHEPFIKVISKAYLSEKSLPEKSLPEKSLPEKSNPEKSNPKTFIFTPVHLPWSNGPVDGPFTANRGAMPSLQAWFPAFMKATEHYNCDKVFGGDFNLEDHEVLNCIRSTTNSIQQCGNGVTHWNHNQKKIVAFDALFLMSDLLDLLDLLDLSDFSDFEKDFVTPAELHPNDKALLEKLLNYKLTNSF